MRQSKSDLQCRVCGAAAVYVDCFHPYHNEYTLCEKHKTINTDPAKLKTCGVCGLTTGSNTSQYYSFAEVRGVYQVGFVDICESCGKKASSFVNYHGYKKDSDLIKLNQFLCGGFVVMRQYSQLVNAGYY